MYVSAFCVCHMQRKERTLPLYYMYVTCRGRSAHCTHVCRLPVEVGAHTVWLQFDGLVAVEDGLGVHALDAVEGGARQVRLRATESIHYTISHSW